MIVRRDQIGGLKKPEKAGKQAKLERIDKRLPFAKRYQLEVALKV